MTIVSGKCQNHTFFRSANIGKSRNQKGSSILMGVGSVDTR